MQVVIFGAGPAGLATALRLAATRIKVTVVDPHPCVGEPYQRPDDDRGTTPVQRILVPAVIRDLGNKTGGPLIDDEKFLLAEHGPKLFLPRNTRITLPPLGQPRWLQHMSEYLTRKQQAQLQELYRLLSTQWKEQRHQLTTEQPPHAASTRQQPAVDFLMSVLSRNHPLAALPLAPTALLAQNPGQAPAQWLMDAIWEPLFGCHSLPGGLPALFEAMRERFLALGGHLILGQEVSQWARQHQIPPVETGTDLTPLLPVLQERLPQSHLVCDTSVFPVISPTVASPLAQGFTWSTELMDSDFMLLPHRDQPYLITGSIQDQRLAVLARYVPEFQAPSRWRPRQPISPPKNEPAAFLQHTLVQHGLLDTTSAQNPPRRFPLPPGSATLRAQRAGEQQWYVGDQAYPGSGLTRILLGAETVADLLRPLLRKTRPGRT